MNGISGIWLNQGDLINELYDITGYKTGLCLTYPEMLKFSGDAFYTELLERNKDSIIRIRPEEYEDLYFNLLQGVGHIASDDIIPDSYFSASLGHKYKKDPKLFDKYSEVLAEFTRCLTEEMDRAERGIGSPKLNPLPFLEQYLKCGDKIGFKMADELMRGHILAQQLSPWEKTRRVEWSNKIALQDLFKSESLETYYGSFLDQRYIDYLSNNLDDVGLINWRKFEALTCEFFERSGYHVEIGKGRNDNGVDARIWKTKADKENPPLILVQCKRQKGKVEKTVVKSLWVDVLYENAGSGLIVTSSHIEKGAKEDRNTRGYEVDFAERETLNEWIQKMRTPNTGLFI